MISKFDKLYQLIMQQVSRNLFKKIHNMPPNIVSTFLAQDLKLPWSSYNRTNANNSITSLYQFPLYYKPETKSPQKYRSLADILVFWFNDLWFESTFNNLTDFLDKDKSNYNNTSLYFTDKRRAGATMKFTFDLIANNGSPSFGYAETQYQWDRVEFKDWNLVYYIYQLVDSSKPNQNLILESLFSINYSAPNLPQVKAHAKEIINKAEDENDNLYFSNLEERKEIIDIINNQTSAVNVLSITIEKLLEKAEKNGGVIINKKISIQPIVVQSKVKSSLSDVIQNIPNICTLTASDIEQIKHINTDFNYIPKPIDLKFLNKPVTIIDAIDNVEVKLKGKYIKLYDLLKLHKGNFYNRSANDDPNIKKIKTYKHFAFVDDNNNFHPVTDLF